MDCPVYPALSFFCATLTSPNLCRSLPYPLTLPSFSLHFSSSLSPYVCRVPILSFAFRYFYYNPRSNVIFTSIYSCFASFASLLWQSSWYIYWALGTKFFSSLIPFSGLNLCWAFVAQSWHSTMLWCGRWLLFVARCWTIATMQNFLLIAVEPSHKGTFYIKNRQNFNNSKIFI